MLLAGTEPHCQPYGLDAVAELSAGAAMHAHAHSARLTADKAECAAGEMSDAAEVLNALKERLEASEEGELMVRAVFGCTIREQLHCFSCGKDTRQHTFCQHLFNASASGMRLNALLMSHKLEGRLPAAVRTSAE
jgi:hypothetical protein